MSHRGCGLLSVCLCLTICVCVSLSVLSVSHCLCLCLTICVCASLSVSVSHYLCYLCLCLTGCVCVSLPVAVPHYLCLCLTACAICASLSHCLRLWLTICVCVHICGSLSISFVSVAATNQEDLYHWYTLVESRLRVLAGGIDRNPAVQHVHINPTAHPLPGSSEFPNCVCFVFGLVLDRKQLPLDLSKNRDDFVASVKSWNKYSERGMWIHIRYCKQRHLPTTEASKLEPRYTQSKKRKAPPSLGLADTIGAY